MRDYIHVTDLASAHLQALVALESGATSATYNLGNGRGYSVREVVAAAERVTGSRVNCTAQPRRAGDPAVLLASSGRARDALGWTPRFEELDVIVETAWHWHQAHPHGYET